MRTATNQIGAGMARSDLAKANRKFFTEVLWSLATNGDGQNGFHVGLPVNLR